MKIGDYEIRYYSPVGKNAAGWRVFFRGEFVFSHEDREIAERWVFAKKANAHV